MNTPSRRQRMQVNSLLAYYDGRRHLFGNREQEVLSALEYAKDLTDREIMVALGYTDMNSVRPRINQLIEEGVISKTGDKDCPVTGKRVRTVSLGKDPRKPQREFEFEIVRSNERVTA